MPCWQNNVALERILTSMLLIRAKDPAFSKVKVEGRNLANRAILWEKGVDVEEMGSVFKS